VEVVLKAGDREVLDQIRVRKVGEALFFKEVKGSCIVFGKDFESEIFFLVMCKYFENVEFSLADFGKDGKGFLRIRKRDLDLHREVDGIELLDIFIF